MTHATAVVLTGAQWATCFAAAVCFARAVAAVRPRPQDTATPADHTGTEITRHRTLTSVKWAVAALLFSAASVGINWAAVQAL